MSATGPATGPARRFIRHTADVPIEVEQLTAGTRTVHSVNVSVGGLAFTCDEPLPIGAEVSVCIPTVRPPFHGRAVVRWHRPEGEQYLCGVEFLDAADTFRVRMVEQVCAIDQYRRHVEEEEGRTLTRDEAAREWISRFGDRFPTS
jgi:hypothetical protein